MARPSPRVFSIAAGLPFLPTLVDALFDGRFGPLPADDPLALSDVTILLPTRRAARALNGAILDRLGGRAAILPSIRPIGDVDEDGALLDADEEAADRLALPAAIAPLDRQLVLARLTRLWGDGLKRELLGLGEDDPLLIPASAADAFHLAGDLARLIDDVASAGIDWRRLDELVPDDLARYWQISLDFLKIVAEQWPQYLAERGMADPAARRDRLIRHAAARLAADGGDRLVIAAGSTGSIPATAALLSTIAHLPRGAVVLPGLDAGMDDAGWLAIGGPRAAISAPGHPQYGMKQLIETIGIDRREVVTLGAPSPALAARLALVSEAMRPAEASEQWAGAPAPAPEATTPIALIEARNEQEEALAIALVLRDALEKGVTAALVTPDRRIAGRVAVEVERFGLAVDDSAGRPLRAAPQAVLARLVLATARSDGAALDVLALAKHPLATFGMARAECRRAIGILDLALFRGFPLGGGLDGLAAALRQARLDAASGERHLPTAIRRLREEEWALAGQLVDAMTAALRPLAVALAAPGRTDVAAFVRLLIAALGEAGAPDAGGPGLFDDEAGAALAGRLGGLLGEEAAALPLSGFEFPAFLDAALDRVAVPSRPGADPRLFIWGTLEARLQSVDRIVLAGLDEGVWPAEIRGDPWLSRSMRAALGLEVPERRLGLSAHDFISALAAPDVVITRAERRGGTPTVPARWLQRLIARIGAAERGSLLARGKVYLDWARALDRGPALPPAPRPRPTPPVEARPKRLSVTEIETLIRDPYAVYARHVLHLTPLEPLDRRPDAALRGSLIHEALGQFARDWSGPFDERAHLALVAVGRAVFRAIEPFPAVHAFWWPRFLAIADWFIGWEAGRTDIVERHAEIAGSWPLENGFRLTGRADRIDRHRDGSLAILDFKTGRPPSAKQLATGLAPQLALEAAMAHHGAFPPLPPGASVSTLGWIGLGAVGRGEPFASAVRDRAPDEIAADAGERLVELIDVFGQAEHPYLSRARPMFEARADGDYDHLARVGEWSVGESEGE